jgi:hypothetical protein
MYREFTAAADSVPQVLSSSAPPDAVASEIADLLDRGALRVSAKS